MTIPAHPASSPAPALDSAPAAAGRPARRIRRGRSRTGLVVTGLLVLSVVPMLGGAFRLTDLAAGAETAENSRFFEFGPLIVAHIVGAAVYSLLGAFQFAPGLRRRPWHRRAGRILLPAGLTVAITGIVMGVSPSLPDTSGVALATMRVGVGVWMIVALALAFAAIRRRDIPTHRAWMIRAYAIALGAGTQVFTVAPLALLAVEIDATVNAIGMGAGWLINVVVAEVIIRRGRRRLSARRRGSDDEVRSARDAAFV